MFAIQKHKTHLSKAPLIAATAGIFALGGVLMTSAPTSQASAAIYTQGAGTTKVVGYIDTIMALNVDKTSVSVIAEANRDNGFAASEEVTAEVSTNSPNGYDLYISTTSSTSLTSSSNNTIPALSGQMAQADFTANRWGFTTDNNTGSGPEVIPAGYYKGIASTGLTKIKASNTSADAEETKVIFAARVDEDQPADTYNGTVVFSLVANPVPTERYTMDGVTTMQDANIATACANASAYSETLTTYHLEDTRDGKLYSIRKLDDGNCWMVENLNLGSDTKDLELTNADTDLRTKQDGTALTSFTLPKSNPGKWTDDETDLTPYMMLGSNIIGGWHQGKGGYYSWGAATAGTGKLEFDNTAPSSICPKGWQLPIAPSTPVIGDKSYYNLLTTTYGITNDAAGSDKLKAAPLSFMVTGYRIHNTPAVNNADSYGRYWTATGANNSNARDLAFHNSEAKSQSSDNPAKGLSIRCVAR